MADSALKAPTAKGDPKNPSDATEEKPKKKKGKKKLIVILLVVVLLAVVYLKFVKGGAPAGPVAPVAGAVVKVEPIYLNLADGHYLKLGLALQATASAPKEVDGSKALDAAIDVFSNMTVDQLTTPATRQAAKLKLTERVVEDYEDEVMDVYLTEFVTQ